MDKEPATVRHVSVSLLNHVCVNSTLYSLLYQHTHNTHTLVCTYIRMLYVPSEYLQEFSNAIEPLSLINEPETNTFCECTHKRKRCRGNHNIRYTPKEIS